MSRAKYSFKESDVTRAFRAAQKAGVDVKVEVDIERRCMSIIPIKPVESDTAATVDNPWDNVFDANQKRTS